VSIFSFALWAPETAAPHPVLAALQFWMPSSNIGPFATAPPASSVDHLSPVLIPKEQREAL